jgi:hypothetical protein
VSVGCPSLLGRVFVQRIRVMGGCVGWVWWVSHRYFGWYVGPGLFFFRDGASDFYCSLRIHLAQQYHGNDHSLNSVSSSRHEAMVGGVLTREGFGFVCRFGCQWGYYRLWIARSTITFVDFSFVDLIFIFRYF